MMVEATLLIEAGGRDRYDRIVVVDVDPATQLARAIARGMSPDDAARRIAHQMPREERLRYADYVIDNSGDLQAAEAETRRVFALLRRDMGEGDGSRGGRGGAERSLRVGASSMITDAGIAKTRGGGSRGTAERAIGDIGAGAPANIPRIQPAEKRSA